MTKRLVVFLFVIFFTIPVTVFASNEPDIVGDAYDLAGGKILYQELHYISDDGLMHRVDYQDPSGRIIARKNLDYRKGLATPFVSQESFTTGELIEIDIVDKKLRLTYLESGGRANIKKATVKQLDIKRVMAIDAGFDNYLRENWQTLIADERLDFYFPAATRSTQVELRVERIECKDRGVGYRPKSEEACFDVNSSFWLFRLFVDPIELRYFTDNKKLSRYRGLGNIPDSNGSNYKVDIRYSYP